MILIYIYICDVTNPNQTKIFKYFIESKTEFQQTQKFEVLQVLTRI